MPLFHGDGVLTAKPLRRYGMNCCPMMSFVNLDARAEASYPRCRAA